MRLARHEGEGEIFLLVLLGVLALAVWGGYALFQQSFPGEQDGVVKYDDCREVITLKKPPLWGQFTCSVSRTTSGKLMQGTCVRVMTTRDGKCTKAYVYEKQTQLRCPDETPFLAWDDKCYAEYDSGRVFAGSPR